MSRERPKILSAQVASHPRLTAWLGLTRNLQERLVEIFLRAVPTKSAEQVLICTGLQCAYFIDPIIAARHHDDLRGLKLLPNRAANLNHLISASTNRTG